MPPRIQVLSTDEMLSTLKKAGHFVTSDFQAFQNSSSYISTPNVVTVDFIRLYRFFAIDQLNTELNKSRHRLSAPKEGLALALYKLYGNLGNISEPIMIFDGSLKIEGTELCLCLQMWNETIRITKTALAHAMRPGNFVLTTSLEN